MKHHGGKLSNALQELFPNLSFSPLSFSVIGMIKHKYFINLIFCINCALERTKRHRLFFEQYARDRNFDPLSSNGWYSQSLKTIAAYQVFLNYISHFKNNIMCGVLLNVILGDSKNNSTLQPQCSKSTCPPFSRN